MRKVVNLKESNRTRQFAQEAGQKSANLFRHLNSIRTSLAGNGENDDRCRRLKIANEKVAREAFVLNAINDTGNVAQIDRRAVWPALHDQITITFRRIELPLRPQRKRLVFAVELAGAGVGSS